MKSQRSITQFVCCLIVGSAGTASMSRSQWSSNFDKIDDAEISKTLAAYRKQGWINVFREKGGNLSGEELLWPSPRFIGHYMGGIMYRFLATT